jgi:hypothetical protein
MRMGLGKPTEMTLRDLLVEELKRRGVVVVPEVSFRTVDGRRLVPDLVLRIASKRNRLATVHS